MGAGKEGKISSSHRLELEGLKESVRTNHSPQMSLFSLRLEFTCISLGRLSVVLLSES